MSSRIAIAALARLGSPLAAALQRGALRHYGDAPLKHQPIFIIGAPRTGSTIFYQAVTNYLDVSYIDNLACRWCRSLYFGMWLSRKLYGAKPHGNFRSTHGDTTSFGAHAPSECGAFWYRWLPRDRHFVDADDVPLEAIEEIRREITAVTNRWDRPVVFKNMNAGQRLRLLKRCFPNAKFIYLRRDHRQIIASMMEVRARTGTPKGELWSIRPRNHVEIASLPEAEMVAEQIRAIERQIDDDLQLFEPADVMQIRFNQFSAELIAEVAEFARAGLRHGGSLPAFKGD